MNKQARGNSRGIEWTDYTWNPVAGCQHKCRWLMPDGTMAICYAESQANSEKMRQFYPQGFEAHYWNLHRLDEPLTVKKPARIFLDSMSDLMGHWAPTEQIQLVLNVTSQAHWHTFQLLTKNAPRLLKFEFPSNVWVGVSSPPDFIMGNPLDRNKQEKMLEKSLEVLSQVNASVKWMSFEPLSWDVSSIVNRFPGALQWAVIGAASNGPRYYQPERLHVERLLEVLKDTPIFFKGNLKGNPAVTLWREEYPN